MNNEIKDIITRVLDGNSSADERKILITWINENEHNLKEYENSEAIWNAYAIIANKEKFNPQTAYNKFVGKYKSNAATNKYIISFNSRILLRIAASILIAFSISFITYRFAKTPANTISYFELNTPNGSHTQLTLTDGTKIWLNAGSKLKYPNTFSGNERIVYLEGEAFFNVKKDPNHPFIVKTSNVNVKALGTSFNVKAYPNEGTIETTLVNGVVVIEGNENKTNKNNTIRLLPNQKATFIKKDGKLMLNENEKVKVKENNIAIQSDTREKESLIVTTNINTELYTSWVENKMVFDNETFESIGYKLERRYGATIVFKKDAIKKYRFSGKFPEISIDRALKALQYASPFQYEIKQDTIFINP